MNVVEFFQHGVAFLPSNEPGIGDVLLVYGKNGERDIVRLSVRGYLQQLVRFFGVDLITIRDRYGKVIGKKQMIPLPLAPEWTLLPIQVRSPIGKQQAHGWIVKQAIERINEGKSIQLKGGHVIPLLHSYEDMRRKLREAQLAEMHFQLLHQTPSWVKESKEKFLYMT